MSDLDCKHKMTEGAHMVRAAVLPGACTFCEADALRERNTVLEDALRVAATMPLHWSSRAKQKKFRALLGDVAEGKVKA